MKKFNALTMLACLALPLVACTNAAEAPKLTGIELTPPTKVSYIVGEQISLDGLEVRAVYSNKSTKVVTDYTTNASSVDMTTEGEKSVKVTYKEFDKSFTISVAYGQKDAWTAAEKTLIEKYAGEELPVPTGLKSNAVVEEVEEEEFDYDTYEYVGTGVFHLEIYDTSATFTIENYYEQLGEEGWAIMVDEDDNPALVDEYGDVYYQAYKRDGLTVYSVQYYFDEGNTIIVQKSELSNELTDETAWSEDEADAFEENLYYVPTFFKAGKGYSFGTEDNAIIISDNYYQDNSSAFITAVTADGFTFDTEEGMYIKPTEEGNIYYAFADFSEFQGNMYYFALYIDKTETTSWPAEFVVPFEQAHSVTVVPMTGTLFTTYKLNGALYIEIAATTDYYYDGQFQQYLTAGLAGSYQNVWGILEYYTVYNWEETFGIEVVTNVDFDDNWDLVFYGYQMILFEIDKPAELFNEVPEASIKSYLGINDFTLPALADPSSKGFKYVESSYEGDDENEIKYTAVSAFDNGKIGKDSLEDKYLAALENAGWWIDDSQYDEQGYIAENPSGSVMLSFFTQFNVFTLYAEAGSGKEHKPVFELNKTEANIKAGKTTQLVLTKEMVPGEVTWTSSNESIATVEDGLVTVSENAQANDEFTITATCSTYEASCAFTVVEAGTGWLPVTSSADLVAGNSYVMGYDKGDGTGFINGALSGKILASVDAEFDDGEIISDVPETSVLTLGGSEGAWTFSFGDDLLRVTKVKELAVGGDKGTETFTIDIDATTHAATIASTNANFGRFLYNVNYPRFTTYTSDLSASMVLPTLYYEA